MRRLEDDDGIDGPHERAWRRAEREDARSVTSDEALALDLERMARTLAGLRARARGAAADRLAALHLEALRLAHELAPDVCPPPA